MSEPHPSAQHATGRTKHATHSPLVLFDGVCNLCNASVAWITAHDRHHTFTFAAMQSDAGKAAIAHSGADLKSLAALDEFGVPRSVILIDESGVHVRSDAAIGIARHLGFPWSIAAAALVIPRPVRDRLYDWVARNRYRWFGRQDSCPVHPPAPLPVAKEIESQTHE